MKDVIIIPTYNEKENIRKLIKTISSLYPNIHILVVDDSSPDGTAQEVEAEKKETPNLELLLRSAKEGLGKAYAAAFKKVLSEENARSICTMDADFSHSARYLSTMFSEIGNFDVVVGSRYVRGGGVNGYTTSRKIVSLLASFYCRTIFHLPIKDYTSGFMCIKTAFLKKIDFEKIGSAGFAFLIELKHLLWKKGASFKEFPILLQNRKEGKSKIGRGIILEGFLLPWTLFFKNYAKKIKDFQQVIKEVIKKRGIFFILYYGPRVFYRTYLKKNKKLFIFQNKKYNYFYHPYNCTCLNERAVEIPIVWKIVKDYLREGRRILEVGNVLSHYFNFEHDIVDKYEKFDEVINQDVVDFRPKNQYDLIVSISTLEHVGFDEEFSEPLKILSAIQNLKKILVPGGKIIITMSLGYNLEMDNLLKEGKIKFTKQYFLKRISANNEWKEANQDEVRQIKYDCSNWTANGLVVGIIEN